MRVFNCKFLVQFIVVQFNLGESRLRIVQDNDCFCQRQLLYTGYYTLYFILYVMSTVRFLLEIVTLYDIYNRNWILILLFQIRANSIFQAIIDDSMARFKYATHHQQFYLYYTIAFILYNSRGFVLILYVLVSMGQWIYLFKYSSKLRQMHSILRDYYTHCSRGKTPNDRPITDSMFQLLKSSFYIVLMLQCREDCEFSLF